MLCRYGSYIRQQRNAHKLPVTYILISKNISRTASTEDISFIMTAIMYTYHQCSEHKHTQIMQEQIQANHHVCQQISTHVSPSNFLVNSHHVARHHIRVRLVPTNTNIHAPMLGMREKQTHSRMIKRDTPTLTH